MVILEAKEDNLLLNNAEVLQGIILDNPHQNIGKKEPVATHLVPNNYQELPPLPFYQFGKVARTKAQRTYTQLARGNYISILSNTNDSLSDPEPKEVVILLKLK